MTLSKLARTMDGVCGGLTMIDEFSRECLAIRVAWRLNSYQVIETLGDCMLEHGVPEHIRSDNGTEMTAERVRKWLNTVGTKPLFIEPGSPWENGYCESFNGKLWDECLNGEIFYSLKEARIVIEMWRKHYNHRRPHSSLGLSSTSPSGLDSGRLTKKSETFFLRPILVCGEPFHGLISGRAIAAASVRKGGDRLSWMFYSIIYFYI